MIFVYYLLSRVRVLFFLSLNLKNLNIYAPPRNPHAGKRNEYYKAKGSAGMLQMWSGLQESQTGLGGMRYSKHGRLH